MSAESFHDSRRVPIVWILEHIPYSTAHIGTERPPEGVFAFFRQLHGVTVKAAGNRPENLL